MISKYIESKEQRAKNKEQRTKSKDQRREEKHIIISSHQNIGGCGIHIVGGLPSANGRQVRAIFSGKW